MPRSNVTCTLSWRPSYSGSGISTPAKVRGRRSPPPPRSLQNGIEKNVFTTTPKTCKLLQAPRQSSILYRIETSTHMHTPADGYTLPPTLSSQVRGTLVIRLWGVSANLHRPPPPNARDYVHTTTAMYDMTTPRSSPYPSVGRAHLNLPPKTTSICFCDVQSRGLRRAVPNEDGIHG